MCAKTPVIVVIAGIAVLFSPGVMPVAAQSLADVARQEQERRQSIKQPSKVLTNDDLRAVPIVAPPPTPADGAAAADTGTAEPATTDAAKPPADATKDQAYWAGRSKELQTQLSRNEVFAEALQSRINALTTQYVNQGDPAQQAVLANDRQKALTELDRVTKQIEADKKAIADLQEEARRAGVPPGWLR